MTRFGEEYFRILLRRRRQCAQVLIPKHDGLDRAIGDSAAHRGMDFLKVVGKGRQGRVVTPGRVIAIVECLLADTRTDVLLAYCAVRKAYMPRTTYTPTADQVEALTGLGKEAIRSGDVPVSALLIYDDVIIGRGYNTVLRDGNAGGHAEVNALSDAFTNLGREGFDRLDRERMVLLTTFEPCAMCKGLILEYRIGHLAFIEPVAVGRELFQEERS